MLRLRQHTVDRALFDHASVRHDGDVLAEVAHNADVVRDEHQGQPEIVGEAAEQVEDLRPHRDVERAHRLVADEELRRMHDRAGECDALALSARELVWVATGHLRV